MNLHIDQRTRDRDDMDELITRLRPVLADLTKSGCDCVNVEDHDDHHEWLKIVIAKEKQRIAFRQAVIEKSLTALLVSAATATFVWVVNHLGVSVITKG
jgi:hypothetical protein